MTDFVHIFISGKVQGVGFRYQTLGVAHGYEVSGYVRNLPDGRVELEAEGAGDELDAFVEAVCLQMDGYIRTVEKSGGSREATMRGFSIR
jgi:acylphosphatase